MNAATINCCWSAAVLSANSSPGAAQFSCANAGIAKAHQAMTETRVPICFTTASTLATQRRVNPARDRRKSLGRTVEAANEWFTRAEKF
jgi:hypothetical protein